MNEQEFESALQAEGYAEVLRRSYEPHPANTEHTHPFDVRALVLAGEFTLAVGGTATVYRPGEVFALAKGIPHTEAVGAGGAEVLLGRRHGAM